MPDKDAGPLHDGRAAQARQLLGLLRSARSGEPSMAVISGRQGMGKTSLLESFLGGDDVANPGHHHPPCRRRGVGNNTSISGWSGNCSRSVPMAAGNRTAPNPGSRPTRGAGGLRAAVRRGRPCRHEHGDIGRDVNPGPQRYPACGYCLVAGAPLRAPPGGTAPAADRPFTRSGPARSGSAESLPP